MHIPKTAGMSLQQIIRKHYRYPEELELIYTNRQNQNGFEDKKDLKVVMGHYRYGFQKYSKREPLLYTFLRNPVEHVISHYFYTLDKPEKFEFLPEGIHNVIDFARCPYGYNLQTRFISGINQIEGNEEEALQTAISHLKEFKLVGLTEAFDTSLLMLKELLGLNRVFYQKRNSGVARTKRQISAEERSELERILQWDIKLYQAAKQLHFEQRKSFKDLESKTKNFKRFNAIFWKINPAYTKLKILLGLADAK